jgi:predicted ester cyclase
MQRSEIADVLARHKAAFDRHDAGALAADHLPDGSFTSPAHGTVHGRPAIEHVYRFWFDAFPDLRLDWESPLIDGDEAALFWRFSGTVQGPFFGITIPGAKVEMPGAAHYTFRDGGIVRVSHVFDFSSVLLKAGVLKAKPA